MFLKIYYTINRKIIFLILCTMMLAVCFASRFSEVQAAPEDGITNQKRLDFLESIGCFVNTDDFSEKEITVLRLNSIELIASKIVALINRSTPRDLFDVCNIVKTYNFSNNEKTMLRKSVVFYMAIASEKTPVEISLSGISAITQNKIKTELLPVLRDNYFDASEAIKICTDFLDDLLQLSKNEKLFLEEFGNKNYRPDLLFDDEDILNRIKHHPMALWKCPEKESVLAKLKKAKAEVKTQAPTAKDKKHNHEL